jgi:hypothetical protein
MLQVIKLKQILHESKSVVSIETYEGNRLDISKKFLKKTKGDNYYFSKWSPIEKEYVITYLYQEKTFIVELDERLTSVGVGIDNKAIYMVKDLIPLDQVLLYEKLSNLVRETPRSAW